MMERNVLVFGATGKTGIQICEQLSEKEINYSVFVREASLEKLTDSSLKKIIGDVLSEEDVSKAIQDNSYTDIIISLGSKSLSANTLRSDGTKYIIDAIKQSKSNAKIHLISAMGVGESWNQMKWSSKLLSNILLKNVMKDHKIQEDVVVNSQVQYHILRPVGLKDGNSLGVIHVQNEGFLPRNDIRRADVAKYLVDSMSEGKTGISGICQGQ
jgi:nucleoside-diphosphate-sugar epimerase